MTIEVVAKRLVAGLAQHRIRIVFAESCTGGLIAAKLSAIPGVSDWFCGSAVVYRCDTKIRWLGVGEDDIQRHTAVSREVAIEMAQAVLARTPEASIAASITGHLGPGAPDELDGTVFICVARRSTGEKMTSKVSRHQLVSSERSERQIEAAGLVMRLVHDEL